MYVCMYVKQKFGMIKNITICGSTQACIFTLSIEYIKYDIYSLCLCSNNRANKRFEKVFPIRNIKWLIYGIYGMVFMVHWYERIQPMEKRTSWKSNNQLI